jgi:hypothetical protein
MSQSHKDSKDSGGQPPQSAGTHDLGRNRGVVDD